MMISGLRTLSHTALRLSPNRLLSTMSDALIPPVKSLVSAATENYGKNDADKKDIDSWLNKIAQGEINHSTDLKALNDQLIPKTYLVGNTLSAADVALYGALHPIISQLQPAQHHAHPSLTRYFNHIQNQQSVRSAAASLAPAFSVVDLDIEGAPIPERKVEAPKKKEKKPQEAAAAAAAAAAAPVKDQPQNVKESKKEGKKEKKESAPKEASAAGEGKKKEKAKQAAPAAADDAGEPMPSMIDLRVGHIVDVIKHPDADGLYIEQIDIGEPTGPRTVVSGLVNYIPIEQMRDKYLVAVCNLKPANMRGVKSFAMVLCATHPSGKEGGIELVQPPEGSKPGDKVYFEGEAYENANPLSQLNPKKKIFETIQPGFTTLDTREAAWVDPKTGSKHRIRTSKGVCVAPTIVGGTLS